MDPNALAQDQQGLRDKLDKIIQGLARNGVQMPGGLDEAGREMGQSRDNLSGNQLGNAEQAQQRALDQLRNSAQQLANREDCRSERELPLGPLWRGIVGRETETTECPSSHFQPGPAGEPASNAKMSSASWSATKLR